MFFRGSLESGGLLAIDPVSDSAIIANDSDQESKNVKDTKILIVPFVDWTTLKVINDSEETKYKFRKLILETQWSKVRVNKMTNSSQRMSNIYFILMMAYLSRNCLTPFHVVIQPSVISSTSMGYYQV